MKKSITRRKFLSLTSTLTATALIPFFTTKKAFASLINPVPDIVVVQSTDYYKATREAVNALGGISSFVKKNSKVCLLINGNFTNEGTFTNPDISFAVLKMCFEAGASEVMLLRADKKEYWQKSSYYDTHYELVGKCSRSAGYEHVPVDKGRIVKQATMIRELYEVDTLINIPISKHHDEAYITCCLKNMMGLNDRATNVLFHSEKNPPVSDPDRLARSIADLNTVRLPDLTIVDSTRFIVTNGPHGPGEIQEENKVLAGTDPVALDAYCARLLDLEPGMVLTTEYAAEHGLGQKDLSKIFIKEIDLV
jgi:uncharacterized protein (DUF362 family)